MDRSDQWMVNFYETMAKEAARNHIFIDFYGALNLRDWSIAIPIY